LGIHGNRIINAGGHELFDYEDIDENAIVSLTWFSKSEHRKLLRKAPDNGELIADYRQWINRMAEIRDRSIEAGAIVVRVPVTVDDMAMWCRRNGYQMDHEGRTAYTQVRAKEMGEAGLFDAEIQAQQGDSGGRLRRR